MTTTKRTVMIIAGEASGDQHGAKLVQAMLARDARLDFWGIGGPALKASGVHLIMDADALSVVGITEAIEKLGQIRKGLAAAKRLLKEKHPGLLILIDFPDFNLMVAAAARRRKIPVLYYISPQIWAWRAGRVHKIKRRVDHMAVILPFEESFYRRHGVPVSFVGHPLLDDAVRTAAPSPTAARRIVTLLPGSRDREVRQHLPLLIRSAHTLKQRFSDLHFVVSCAPNIDKGLIQEIVSRQPVTLDGMVSAEPVAALFRRSTLAIAVSGTVTLQAAIHGTPLIIIYRVSPLSYWLARTLVRVDHIGLVNLISGKPVAPELIQTQATPGAIAEKATELLANPKRLADMRRELLAVRSHLGQGGVSQRVAQIALALMDGGIRSGCHAA
jgi:lipid-A-disaccharide synthase